MTGFVALYREAVEHPLFAGDSARLGAWFWMVAKACWKPTKFNAGGKVITLERGQFCRSVRDMADAWGWSKSAVDRFLTRLKTEGMIGTESGTGRLIITICNYSKYQDIGEDTGTLVGTPTGTAAGQQRDIKEQGNKGTKEEGGGDAGDGLVDQGHAEDGDEGDEGTPPEPLKVLPHRMPDDWQPSALPANVARLVDLWPPGRLEREIDQFRDYWLDRTERRPGWDRSFHNRIRDIHDRVLRESSHGNRRTSARTDDEPRNPLLRAELARQGRAASGVG